ncbi:type II 3-dehydroquinate dehydratase [Atopobiaceae bacterium 24-176]
MDYKATAQQVLDACGGKANVRANAICMTRLRLELQDTSKVDSERLGTLHSVLGIRSHGANGVEVVFGPAIIDAIALDFCKLTDLPLGRKTAKAISAMAVGAPRRDSRPRQETLRDTNPARRASYAAQRKANRAFMATGVSGAAEPAGTDDLDQLRRMLEGPGSLLDNISAPSEPKPALDPLAGEGAPAPRLLVLNGPNINMLGVREPDIYGTDTYADLVALCKQEGKAAGFTEVRCFQSNHEGALVDEIQGALDRYEAIVLNPAAYTHTSVALLDALKAVGVPCVEVHISDVSSREDFRQVSYVRPACIATVTGEGLEGYGHAIRILAAALGE